MLASLAWPPAQDRHLAYLPPRPSPLSPRSANACQTRQHYQSHSMPKPQPSPSRTKHRDVPFSKRPIKQNPFSQRSKDPSSREAARETRRKLFLQQVAQKRDDRHFEERGDHLMRLDWKSDRRRWEDEKARSASRWSDLDAEDAPLASQGEAIFPSIFHTSSGLMDTVSFVEQPVSDDGGAEAEAERLRQLEEGEMDELIALMHERESPVSSRYGSDDEYDGIFSDLLVDDGGGGGGDKMDDEVAPAEKQGDVDMSG